LITIGLVDSIQIVNALLEATSLLEFDISTMTINCRHCLKPNQEGLLCIIWIKGGNRS
jgi:transportin-3